MDIETTLKERGKTHGDFVERSELSQGLQALLLEQADRNSTVTKAMRESLQMICVKLSRIVKGQASHVDSWRDIAGYTELVVKTLTKEEPETLAEIVASVPNNRASFYIGGLGDGVALALKRLVEEARDKGFEPRHFFIGETLWPEVDALSENGEQGQRLFGVPVRAYRGQTKLLADPK